MAGFEGFGPDTFGFFRALGFHQDRDWFQANKAIYETQVREPLIALVEELTKRFAKAGIPLKGGPKSLFRINRDVRFAKDKRPYQTHASAMLTPTGEKWGHGLVYVHIAPPNLSTMDGAPEGSFVAVGFHMPDPDVVAALRGAIRKDPKAWLAMEAKLAKSGLKLGTGDAMKRLPRGFEDMKDSPVESALRLRSYVTEEPLPETEIGTAKLADTIVAVTNRARPLLDFGWKVLG